MSAVSARGMFAAMGKARKSRIVDIVDGEAVRSDERPRQKDDFEATPPEAIDSFIAYERERLREFSTVWEPAAGDGAIVRPLREFGLNVFASDLVDRGCGAEITSFYDFDAAGFLPIITNPPFQETNWRDAKGRWLYHALEELAVPYMALLLPITAFAAGGFCDFWAKHAPARVYLMRWKLDFTGEGAPSANHCWYVWDGHTAPENTRLLMMDRKDWRQGSLFQDQTEVTR